MEKETLFCLKHVPSFFFLQGHLHFFHVFFFTFIGHFLDDPISTQYLRINQISTYQIFCADNVLFVQHSTGRALVMCVSLLEKADIEEKTKSLLQRDPGLAWPGYPIAENPNQQNHHVKIDFDTVVTVTNCPYFLRTSMLKWPEK